MYFLFLTLYVFDTILQIERWWRELHELLEKYFKDHLNWLKDRGEYNPHNKTDRCCAFLYLNTLLLQLNIFLYVLSL